MLNLGIRRPLVTQAFRAFTVAVTTTAQPIDPVVDKTKLINSFVISVPSAGISVFFGNQGVTATAGGLEIIPGTSPNFSISQEGRQLYELQSLLLNINSGMACQQIAADPVPFVCWDMSRIFLVATAPQNVTVCEFYAMYI